MSIWGAYSWQQAVRSAKEEQEQRGQGGTEQNTNIRDA